MSRQVSSTGSLCAAIRQREAVMSEPTISRRLAAEFTGTAGLLCAVVGSGIMAERLSAGNEAIALLTNTIATGAALVALILVFAPVSGAHLNPAVSLAAAINGELNWRDLVFYIAGQLAGAIAGVAAANTMFGLPVVFASTRARTGVGLWLGEFIAAFGLVGVIIAVSRRHTTGYTAAAVACFITAAYWFTSSTSFANPAVTIARSLSDTFAGIAPEGVVAFIAAQMVGMLAALAVDYWLWGPVKEPAALRNRS